MTSAGHDLSQWIWRWVWTRRGLPALALWPLSVLFCGLVVLRRTAYRHGLLPSRPPPRPVILVGNLSVGGTGKTPLVAWLAAHARARGWRPGILARGYGGRAGDWPRRVSPGDSAAEVGDEPLLLARECGVPVAAGPDRVKAGALLAEDCDLLISDDGLQHYALARDLEIAVVDGQRRLGNGFCLPAGPLREPPARLTEVDLVVANGLPLAGEFRMDMVLGEAVSLTDPDRRRPLESFTGERRPLALAGIGNPDRFFAALAAAGLDCETRAFPDHHPFRAADLAPFAGRPVLMTAKDGVKCEAFATPNLWYVPVRALPEAAFVQRIDTFLATLQ